jgi:hypothetical protein
MARGAAPGPRRSQSHPRCKACLPLDEVTRPKPCGRPCARR